MSDELLNEFIFDSRDHLGTAGAQLLDLEKNPASLDALNALMGTMHSIKGNSGFLDLQHLYQLMHHAESLLQTVRETQRPCPQKLIDLLLQVLDTVEAILARLENGESDDADWLEALNAALSEAEARMEGTAPPPQPAPAAAAPAAQATPAQETKAPTPAKKTGQAPASSPAPAIKDDLKGKINLLALKDGQLAQEAETFPPRVEAMFQAGLKGLVVDLRSLDSVSGQDVKVLTAAGRHNPQRTAYLLDVKAQESLHRVFKVLNLDRFMRFFPDQEAALAFIKQGG
jgi:chemotaxis protein histidine kinase CheA